MPMFQVANIRLQKQQQQQKTISRQSVTLQVSPQTSVQTSVVMKQGITTMDPPPSMVFIDQNLHRELTKRFPEVPNDVICKLMQQNGNHREQCMMALARESQNYPVANPINPINSNSNIILQSPSSETQVTISNGLRNRSDSAGSRGSISSVGTGQSPTAHHQYPSINPGGVPPGGVPQYRHSSSDPHATNIPNHYVPPTPNTAPAQPENFTPFPNMHHAGGDYGKGGLDGPTFDPSYSGQQHGYRQWGPSTSQHPHNYSAAGVHSQAAWRSPPHGNAGGMNPVATQYTPSPRYESPVKGSNITPSRPGQFDQKFPPSSWDESFSPGSPHKWTSPMGGTPKTVPTSQSPVTTPPRNHHAWDAPPTTSPMYRAPSPSGYPGQRHDYPGSTTRALEQPGSTYISSISKYILPNDGNHGNNEPNPYRGSQSININLGQADTAPYNTSAMSSALPRTTLPGATAVMTYHMQGPMSGSMPYGLPEDQPWRSLTTTVVTPPNIHTNNLPMMLGGEHHPPLLHDLQRTPSGDGRQSRSGSLAGSEDLAYTQSLLMHQKARLEKLKQDIATLYNHRDMLQARVKSKEQCILKSRRQKLGQRPSISATDLQKVRDENRSLQVDSHLLTLEFDRITKGQAVIGSSDPNENFYKRIHHGQTGVPTSTETSESSSSSTTAVSHISSHPPAPPSLVSAHRDSSRHLHELVEEENWSCSACTFANHPELGQCEMCNMPRVGRR